MAGFSPARPMRMQGAGQRDIVEVVAGGLCHGSFLAPARHAAIDQGRVLLQADLRAQAQAFHDAGAVALQQGVGLAHQLQDGVHPLRCLQIHADAALAAIEKVQSRLLGVAEHAAPGPLHADNVCAHIRQ